MSRDALNACITNLVQQVVDLKNMLLKPASSWDIRAVAAQCKKTAVGIKDYGEQVQQFNNESTWKIPEDKFEVVIQSAREFILYAQNCCRSQSSDESKIKSLGTKLSDHIRAVVAMERESRAIFANPPTKQAPKKPTPDPTPVAVAAPSNNVDDEFDDIINSASNNPPAASPAPSYAQASTTPANDDIDDLFGDVGVPTDGPVATEDTGAYGNFGQLAGNNDAPPAMAADDELDDLLSGLESAAPPASNISSDAQGAMDELDMLTADLGGGGDYSSDVGGGTVTDADAELDALLADMA